MSTLAMGMNWKRSLLILLAASLGIAACDTPPEEEIDTDIETPPGYSCISPGEHCMTTGDCCGGATCQNNFCAGIAIPAGGHCRTSSDCSGTGTCVGQVCVSADPGYCSQPGRHCDSSGDCCGIGTCDTGGFCAGSGNLQRGRHCRSTSDCAGILTCQSLGFGPKVCF